jgi:hypothetical protein
MLKDKEFGSGRDIMEPIRDGESSMLTNPRRKEPLDTIENTDSISTEHSTSDLDSQCGELLKLFLTILDSEDITFQERDNKLGSSIEFRIPSSLNIPNPTPFTWQPTIVTPISESLLPAQDGGKCSE